MATAVRRNYQIRPAKVEEAKDRFRRTFDALDARLAHAPYLLGDAPGRADVSVAALLAPLCRPPEHIVRWPDFPPEARPFVAEFEQRPTWDLVLRMYKGRTRVTA